MINIYELLKNTLKPLGYDVKEQGTYKTGTTLPETFITYFFLQGDSDDYADNKAFSRTYTMQINLYSRKPLIKQTADTLLQSVLLPANFMRQSGSARDLPFDSTTLQYCFTVTYTYFELF